MLTLLLATSSLLADQDKPVDVPKSNLPKTSALCVVCEADGTGHGPEKIAAGVIFRAQTYFFCNPSEVGKFKKDPEAYLPPVLPRPMPKFSLADTSGQNWTAESMKGRLVLIDFWATWCKPCHEMKPVLERVQKSFSDLTVLSVSIDEKRADFDKFLAKTKFTNPVLFDDRQTWADWRVRVVPTFFLVKDGQIIAQWAGKKSEKDITELIKGQR